MRLYKIIEDKPILRIIQQSLATVLSNTYPGRPYLYIMYYIDDISSPDIVKSYENIINHMINTSNEAVDAIEHGKAK